MAQQDTYQQLGTIVRQLHDALQQLGYDQAIRQIATEIPDARDRLAYVGGMTEAAASKVLNLVDAATPACAEFSARASSLGVHLEEALGSTLAADDGQAARQAQAPLLRDCAEFARRVESFAETQRSTLTDIMMAQDFQDLSGQVIGKVISIISRTEQQLVELLVHSQPQDTPQEAEMLAGPQVPEKALKQDDVDDLLASLGF